MSDHTEQGKEILDALKEIAAENEAAECEEVSPFDLATEAMEACTQALATIQPSDDATLQLMYQARESCCLALYATVTKAARVLREYLTQMPGGAD